MLRHPSRIVLHARSEICYSLLVQGTTNKKYQLTLDELFKYNGYNLQDYADKSNVWLKPTKKMHIVNRHNQAEQVTHLYVNGEATIYEIPLEDGSTIKCTGDHKWLVESKDSNGHTVEQWKRTEDLEAGDIISGGKNLAKN